jgi:hypothetical protein
MKQTKPSASDQRHVMVVIRLVSDSQESPREEGSEGAGAMPGDNEIRVSEFLLRRMVQRRVLDQREGRAGFPSLDRALRRLSDFRGLSRVTNF